MQQPTCINIRIRSTNDAHKIFAAIQRGILHMVTRRLDADERLALRSGCIYAWEERGPHSELTGLGIERFTEGRRWSPSRVRDEFLFYYEKYAPPPDANHTVIGHNSDRQLQPPRDWDPLVKQTYSVWVQTENGRRKWHLTAYFTQTTIDQLGTIDDNPQIRDISVEEGMFKSTRVGKSRTKTDDSSRSDVAKASPTVARTYAPFPTPYQYHANETGSATPVLMHEPYQSRQLDQSPSSGYEQTPSPISSSPVVPYLSHGVTYPGASPTPGHYIPAGYPLGSSSNSSGIPCPTDGPSNPDTQMSALHGHAHGPNYYSGGAVSPPPWNGNNAFGQRAADPFHRQQQPHGSPNMNTNIRASSYPASPYRSAANASPHPYVGNMTPGHNNQVFPSSYSLHSALVMPNTEMSPVPMNVQLSPLHIPDRVPQQSGGMVSSSMTNPDATNMAPPGDTSDVPMDAAAGDEGDEGSLLARLPLLRPPVVKYVRDPQDEKILRRLRDGNGSS